MQRGAVHIDHARAKWRGDGGVEHEGAGVQRGAAGEGMHAGAADGERARARFRQRRSTAQHAAAGKGIGGCGVQDRDEQGRERAV